MLQPWVKSYILESAMILMNCSRSITIPSFLSGYWLLDIRYWVLGIGDGLEPFEFLFGEEGHWCVI